MSSSIVQFVIKILFMILKKKEADDILMQKFLDFIEAMDNSRIVPVKLHDSYNRQLAKLKAIRDGRQ